MPVKKRYEGVIEEWPAQSRLYIRVLPGFFASAPTREQLIEESLDAIDFHLEWLDGHGYSPALEDEGGLVVIEDLPSAPDGAGPLFESDRPEPDHAEIEAALGIGRVALSDIIDLVDLIAGDEPLSGDIERVLRDLADRDLWLATRLGGAVPNARRPGNPLDAMIHAAGLFEEKIDEIAEGKRPGVVVADGEPWTLAKLLRRRTADVREHALELAAMQGDE